MKTRIVLAAVLLALPSVAAHSATVILDNETIVLLDATDDTYAVLPGYDIQSLSIRDAFWRPAQEAGVIFRITAYGNIGPGASDASLAIGFTANGTSSMHTATTTDDATWTSDLRVIEAITSTDQYGATSLQLQLFAPYSTLGVGTGGTLTDVHVLSYTDETLVDAAPGGRFLPIVGGIAEIPEIETYTADPYTVGPPDDYTTTRLSQDGTIYTLEVENSISVVGQHIFVDVDDAPGWTLGAPNPPSVSINAGTHPTFTFTAEPGEGATSLQVHVTTDLGGRETLTISPPGTSPGQPSPGPNDGGNDGDEGDGKDSPLPAAAWIAALIVGVAWIRRATR